ncbi:unnamed protein product, partial [Amoebophrya sp. A25]
NQLCEACTVLLLTFASRDASGFFIAEALREHQSTLFSTTLPRVFHKEPLTRLRSLQLLAALLFDREFLYPQGYQN